MTWFWTHDLQSYKTTAPLLSHLPSFTVGLNASLLPKGAPYTLLYRSQIYGSSDTFVYHQSTSPSNRDVTCLFLVTDLFHLAFQKYLCQIIKIDWIQGFWKFLSKFAVKYQDKACVRYICMDSLLKYILKYGEVLRFKSVVIKKN